jgi:hypothetical protein
VATDYDAPRKQDDDDTQSIEVLKERTASVNPQALDIDESDAAGDFLTQEIVSDDLDVVIVPAQDDEFTCVECFIVKHHSLIGKKTKAGSVCIECSS